MLAWAVVLVAVILAGVTASVLVRRAVEERRGADRIRSVFSRYVSPYVVEEILARKDPRIFEGRSGTATILFCRIWNFALFAENLTPDQTLRYLNEFYTLTGASIQKHHGMIDKFLGDGIMGVFGLPLDDPHQAEHAIDAALDIVRLVNAMNTRWKAQGRKPFQIGIGINSGEVISGDTGFARRREYTAVGNAVIVASRLQEATEQFGAFVLASSSTYDVVREMYTAVPMQGIPLRGMRQLQTAYVIRGLARHGKDDALLLPSPQAFRQTIVAERERAAAAAAPPEQTPSTEAPAAQTAVTAAQPPRANGETALEAPPPEPAPDQLAAPPAAAAEGRKRKRRLISQSDVAATAASGGRFETPQPEPRKPDAANLWIPPQREYSPAKTYESAEPALPELPAPPMTYEDQHGPPLELPP